jgi:hypothetical protein
MHSNNPPIVKIQDDHEVSMARAQVYRAAKCAMEIHKMLHQVDNLEGWMQSKITLAADYLESVSSNLEYDIVSAVMEPTPVAVMPQAPVMNVLDTQADLVENNSVDQAKADGLAVAASVSKNPNGKPQNPHRAGSPEHRAWQQAHDEAKKNPMAEAELFPQLRQDMRQIGKTVGDAWQKYWQGSSEEQKSAQDQMRKAWIRYFRSQKQKQGEQVDADMMRTFRALADEMVAYRVNPPLMSRVTTQITDPN